MSPHHPAPQCLLSTHWCWSSSAQPRLPGDSAGVGGSDASQLTMAQLDMVVMRGKLRGWGGHKRESCTRETPSLQDISAIAPDLLEPGSSLVFPKDSRSKYISGVQCAAQAFGSGLRQRKPQVQRDGTDMSHSSSAPRRSQNSSPQQPSPASRSAF